MKPGLRDQYLAELIHDADERAFDGRMKRLRFLLSRGDQEAFPASALAKEYHEEARLCWYVGAFVATIVMSQLTLEEMLRSYYRHPGVARVNGKKVDDASFADLISQASTDGLLTATETKMLHKLRQRFRNPYVHPKEAKAHKVGRSLRRRLQRRDWLAQLIKISALEGVKDTAESEARESIRTVVTLFPNFSRRVWGLA